MIDNYRDCTYYSILVIITIWVIYSCDKFLKHLSVIIFVPDLFTSVRLAITSTSSTSTITINGAVIINVLMSPAIDRISICRRQFPITKIRFAIGVLLLIIFHTIATLQKS